MGGLGVSGVGGVEIFRHRRERYWQRSRRSGGGGWRCTPVSQLPGSCVPCPVVNWSFGNPTEVHRGTVQHPITGAYQQPMGMHA